MAYELISDDLPFAGPSLEEFREQHLHAVPAELIGAPTALIAVVQECLYRSAAARPCPANVLERLGRVASPPVLEGLARLQEVNRAEVDRRGAAAVAASRSQSEEERRRELADDAALALERISISLKDSILNAASTVEVAGVTPGFSYQALLDWELQMNAAKIGLSKSAMVSIGAWQGRPVPFDVIASADLTIRIPSDRSGYEGRSHSLWFCDARAVNEYGWFETAFMVHPLVGGGRPGLDPFALDPGIDALDAIGPITGTTQMAWPFTRIIPGQADEFISRWAGWFADAAAGQLHHPTTMPERDPQGTWRRG